MSINVSKKHGVNPSLDTCFYCGESKGIVLFGKLKDDAEAPMKVFTNYEPCDKCKAKMSTGVTILSVSTTNSDNLPPISYDENDNPVYPTREFVVLKTDAANRLIQKGNLEAGDKICMDKIAFNNIFSNVIKETENEKTD